MFQNRFDAASNLCKQAVRTLATPDLQQARNATSGARRPADVPASGLYDKLIYSESLHANHVTRRRQPSLAAMAVMASSFSALTRLATAQPSQNYRFAGQQQGGGPM